MKHTHIFNVSDLIGWIGTFCYILAYLLLSAKKLKAEQKSYHLLNIAGALGLIVNAIHLNDYPNIIVNIVWFVIGLISLIFIIKRK